MSRRMLAIVLIAAFAFILVSGCSETEQGNIKNTVNDFVSAYNAEDWEVCLGHTYDANSTGASTIQSVYEQYRAASGELTVDGIERIVISGSSATADVRLTYNDRTETQKWSFVKRDGDWKRRFPDG